AAGAPMQARSTASAPELPDLVGIRTDLLDVALLATEQDHDPALRVIGHRVSDDLGKLAAVELRGLPQLQVGIPLPSAARAHAQDPARGRGIDRDLVVAMLLELRARPCNQEVPGRPLPLPGVHYVKRDAAGIAIAAVQQQDL